MPRHYVTTRDLIAAQRGRAPRLVFLAACEAGVSGIERDPNEFIGLPSAYIRLGAAGVVSSLWRIDDVAAAIFAAKFYSLWLQEGIEPPSALRQTQLWLASATADDLHGFVQDVGALATSDQDATALTPLLKFTEDLAPGSRPFEHPVFWGGYFYTGV